MDLIRFKEEDLPLKDLETIGLAVNSQLLLTAEDKQALLTGRRTGLMQLRDLEAENIKIRSLDAKLSLQQDANGTSLLIHPVYKRAVAPGLLNEKQINELRTGQVSNLLIERSTTEGKRSNLLVEYDPETREFISSDTDRILAPDMVNNEFLTAAQKEAYRKGKEVKLADQTSFAYTGVDTQGMRSDKIALIASILIDGGMTYMLYMGLNALFGQKHDKASSEKLSPGYHAALNDAQQQPIINEPVSHAYKRGVFTR